jgi:hypothetical protein
VAASGSGVVVGATLRDGGGDGRTAVPTVSAEANVFPDGAKATIPTITASATRIPIPITTLFNRLFLSITVLGFIANFSFHVAKQRRPRNALSCVSYE